MTVNKATTSINLLVEPLVDKEEWENFVATSPKGTFFHTLKWKDLLEASFPVLPMYTVIRDSKAGLVGICPFFIWKEMRLIKVIDSLPYSDYAGPLINEGYTEPAMKALLTYLKLLAHRQGIIYAKIRFSSKSLSKYINLSDIKIDTSIGTMVLDLQNKPLDFIWNDSLGSKRRDQYSKMERDGYQIKECANVDDLNTFYNLHHKGMSDMGLPYFPYTFFKRAFDSYYPHNFNILLMVNQQRCFAGLQFLIYEPSKTIYQTFVGIDRKIRYRGTPYIFLTWELIKWAQKNGYRYVDFGSTPLNPDDVHYRIKNYFGGEFNQDYYVYLPFNHKLYFMRENIKKIWRHLEAKLPRNFTRGILDLVEHHKSTR